ncbi:MAG: hypothetical protein Q8R78_00750 [Candidatus Omnitrophota bacterium]|nr:hypothetical protein [Candidatus Omnitrophota bacterium]
MPSIIESAMNLIRVLDSIPARIVEDAPLGSCHGGDISPVDHLRIVQARRDLFDAIKHDYQFLKDLNGD